MQDQLKAPEGGGTRAPLLGEQVTRQIQILHLSDLHFGEKHRFQPDKAPNGDRPEDPGFPSLLDKFSPEIDAALKSKCPLIVCVTGDITEIASDAEFEKAEAFFKGMFARYDGRLSKANVFVVPGNHDVKFDEAKIGLRWSAWTQFYNRLYEPTPAANRDTPTDCVALHTDYKNGYAVLCLNSAIFVQHKSGDENRGRFAVDQLKKVEELLKRESRDELHSAIKVALVHHHPVLIPALAERGRGYDAIEGSGTLLSILRKFGFQLILHGHKHLATTFTEDTRIAAQRTSDHVMLVCAGGSAGSNEIPEGPQQTNTYNRIVIKWHPDARHSRVRVETRGLQRYDHESDTALPAYSWNWKTIRIDDRVLSDGSELPDAAYMQVLDFDQAVDGPHDKARTGVYETTRGNLAVTAVMPSLINEQAYEARLWIVQKPGRMPKDTLSSRPLYVEWRGGPMFPVIRVNASDDSLFSARIDYWGPVLMQARMVFADGYEAYTYVFVRIPESNLTKRGGS